MAEALAIVGLVSAIVQFISFSTEVIGRLNDFCAKSKDVPPAFRDISVRLPLLRSNLKRTKEEAEAKKLDVDVQNSVLAVVESCQAHVQVGCVEVKGLCRCTCCTNTLPPAEIVHRDGHCSRAITRLNDRFLFLIMIYGVLT